MMAPSSPDATTERRLKRLQQLHGAMLLNYVRKITLGDLSLTEEIVQETFIRAWRHLQRDEEVDLQQFRPWLFTVARRLVIDSLRSRRARPTEVIFEDLARFSDASDAIGDMLNAETVRAALLRIRPDQRELLLDLYHYGRNPNEVAAKLNIPVGTVKSRSHVAKRALRTALNDLGHGNG